MTTLSQQLSSPLTSLEELINLLGPYLDLLQLIPDRQDLLPSKPSTSTSSSTTTISTEKETKRKTFLKRQLGLVQKILIESIWLDWEHVVISSSTSGEEQGKALLEVLFERWFIPPLVNSEEGEENSTQDLANEIAISSYAVLNSLLSSGVQLSSTSSNSAIGGQALRKESLEIITRLLAKLTSIYTVDLLYPTVFRSSTLSTSSTLSKREGEEERTITKASARWSIIFKDISTIPDKLMNAWGRLMESTPGINSINNLNEVIPIQLEWSYHSAAITQSYVKLLILLSTPPTTSTSTSSSVSISISLPSLALPLHSFSPSFYTSTSSFSSAPSQPNSSTQSFFPHFFQIALPILLPSFPTSSSNLILRKTFLELWKEVMEEGLIGVGGMEGERFTRGFLGSLEGLFSVTSGSDVGMVGNGSRKGKIVEILEGEEEEEEKRKKEQEIVERKKLKGASDLAFHLLGPLAFDSNTDDENWKLVMKILIEPRANWSRSIASLLPSWIGYDFDETFATATSTSTKTKKKEIETSLVQLLNTVMTQWGSIQSIKSAPESTRIYLTTLLLLIIVSLPPLHPSLLELSKSKFFLDAISSHLGMLSVKVRYLGMLTAEILSSRTIAFRKEGGGEGMKPLDFGKEIWEGNEEGKEFIRDLRGSLKRFEEERKNAGKVNDLEGWQDILLDTWCRRSASSKPLAPPISSKSQRQLPLTALPISPPLKKPLITVLNPSPIDKDDLQPYPLPAPPSSSYLNLLQSSDPSLYASALPSTSSTPGGSSTRKRGKLRPPVYIPELVAYLRGLEPEGGGGTGGGEEKEDEKAERVECALREGEGLIRRKRGWGGELDENSVDLTFALIGLQDVYELENFDSSKSKMLIALVVCCPTLVAPTMVEQYYSRHYTVSQRYMILTALALGARELAGLPTIPSSQQLFNSTTPSSESPPIDLFPSKRLPPALHRKLIGTPTLPNSSTIPRGALEDLTEELTRTALSDAKEDAELTLPLAAKEKLLTIRRFTSAPASRSNSNNQVITSSHQATFPNLASEYFILPLINRFWLYLKDSATSPSTNSKSPYAGGRDTPTLLEPLILGQYFATLNVLLHAARHSPYFLAVLVPEVLELLLSLRLSSSSSSVVGKEGGEEIVLANQMELILTVLDSSILLDGGKTLMSSRGMELISECKDWSEVVFEIEESKGGDGKGMGIGRVGRAAAGVLLRIEEIFSRWRGRVGY